MKKASGILEDWLKGNLGNRDAYLKLYKQVTGYDRHMAKRYNDLTGSRYLLTVIGLLSDEVVSEDELHDFSDNTRELIVEANKKLKD